MRAWRTAAEIAGAVAARRTTAVAVLEATLERIKQHDSALNAFTALTPERALAKARAIDLGLAQGRSAEPLTGVPFAVKNLIDVAGLATLAGSKINANRPPAA